MTCADCCRVDIRNEALNREVDRLRDDVKEAEAQLSGMLAAITRLREQLVNFRHRAGQVAVTP
jgi:hypothetical protein